MPSWQGCALTTRLSARGPASRRERPMNGAVERLGRPRREVSERLFGRRPWLCRVDDDLLIRLGVGGECVPVERDFADHWGGCKSSCLVVSRRRECRPTTGGNRDLG